ncbi:hypothetical protein BRO54_3326 [Geobacillus proteiniphilus]|uniref:Uncharacterized protein n=1 Tax=Geobacillus proteiniphilus TaxID=860353 RepID=A0A1Q5SNL3_9BACL|nr:hypothetical protein BRO54_3326 [Geobacillus proteiniphilus]
MPHLLQTIPHLYFQPPRHVCQTRNPLIALEKKELKESTMKHIRGDHCK